MRWNLATSPANRSPPSPPFHKPKTRDGLCTFLVDRAQASRLRHMLVCEGWLTLAGNCTAIASTFASQYHDLCVCLISPHSRSTASTRRPLRVGGCAILDAAAPMTIACSALLRQLPRNRRRVRAQDGRTSGRWMPATTPTCKPAVRHHPRVARPSIFSLFSRQNTKRVLSLFSRHDVTATARSVDV